MQATAVLGVRRLSPDDPETIDAFRQVWKARQEETSTRPRPGPRGFFATLARRLGARRTTLEDILAKQVEEADAEWRGSFEEVLERALARQPTVIIFPQSGEGEAGMPKYQAFVQYFGFRGELVRPQENAITRWLLSHPDVPDVPELTGTIVRRAYQNHTPQQMLTLADAMERALSAYRRPHASPNALAVDIYENAIRWLRFWGSRGFGFVADY